MSAIDLDQNHAYVCACVDLASVKGQVSVFPWERENFTDPQGRSVAVKEITSLRAPAWLQD